VCARAHGHTFILPQVFSDSSLGWRKKGNKNKTKDEKFYGNFCNFFATPMSPPTLGKNWENTLCTFLLTMFFQFKIILSNDFRFCKNPDLRQKKFESEQPT